MSKQTEDPMPSWSLFPNGTSFMIWHERNCSRCWKCPKAEHSGHNRKCAIENAIALAACTDGSLLHDGERTQAEAKAIGDRLGWDGTNYLESDCPEREEKRSSAASKTKAKTDKIDDLPLFKP